MRLSRQAVIEVEQTLRAGLADADAADAILSGMLERPLQYAGLGFTGDADAVGGDRSRARTVVDGQRLCRRRHGRPLPG